LEKRKRFLPLQSQNEREKKPEAISGLKIEKSDQATDNEDKKSSEPRGEERKFFRR
jgi:hypothetical protein